MLQKYENINCFLKFDWFPVYSWKLISFQKIVGSFIRNYGLNSAEILFGSLETNGLRFCDIAFKVQQASV